MSTASIIAFPRRALRAAPRLLKAGITFPVRYPRLRSLRAAYRRGSANGARDLPYEEADPVIVETGRTLYVAGQTARDAQGNVVCKGDAAGQTRQVLENMKRVIEGAGGRMEDVAKTTVYITDIKYREAVGQVRQEYFKSDRPASTLLVVAGLADPAFLVEIEAIVPLP